MGYMCIYIYCIYNLIKSLILTKTFYNSLKNFKFGLNNFTNLLVTFSVNSDGLHKPEVEESVGKVVIGVTKNLKRGRHMDGNLFICSIY